MLPPEPKLRALLPAQGPAVPVPQPAAYEQHQRQDGHMEAQAIGEHVEGTARGLSEAQTPAVRALHIEAQQRLARGRAEIVQAERLEQQHERYGAYCECHRDADAREVHVRPRYEHDGRQQQLLAEQIVQHAGKIPAPGADELRLRVLLRQ